MAAMKWESESNDTGKKIEDEQEKRNKNLCIVFLSPYTLVDYFNPQNPVFEKTVPKKYVALNLNLNVRNHSQAFKMPYEYSFITLCNINHTLP